MAWRRSYVFTPRVEESEIDSSDESDSEVGTETLKLYHRRKSTVTAVKARVRFIWITLYMLHKYFQTAKMHDVSWSRVPCYLFVLLRNPLWDYFQALVFKCFNPRIINLQFCCVYKTASLLSLVISHQRANHAFFLVGVDLLYINGKYFVSLCYAGRRPNCKKYVSVIYFGFNFLSADFSPVEIDFRSGKTL